MKPPLTLIIARHAESGYNNENRIQGHLDSKLTPRGTRQAKALARRLAHLKVKRVYSSDLGRAFSTTRTVVGKLKLPIVAERDLREIALGKWEGLTPDEVNRRFKNGYDQWRRAPSRMRIPGGETILQFHRRIRNVFDRIVRTEKTGVVLVMTHGGVISSILSHWMKADFDRVLLNLRIDNTGLTVAEFRDKRVILHAVNDVMHLSDREKSDGIPVFTQRR